MGQKIFHNWQDDDSTKDLDHARLGLNEPGRYRGFDLVTPLTGMTLQLNQAGSGAFYTLFDNPTWTVEQRGVILTKQGVLINDTQTLSFNINPNATAYPRYDIVVCEHEYVNTPGGSTVSYYIEQGTPANPPVIPTPTTPAQCKIVLGWLYVPAGCTNLASGAVYTPAPVPAYDNDPTIMRTGLDQFSTARKKFANIEYGAALQVIYNSGSGGYLDFQHGLSNNFVVDDPGGLTDYVNITNINNVKYTSDGVMMKCHTKIALKFLTTGNIQFLGSGGSEPLWIEIGEVFEIWDLNGMFGTTNSAPTYFILRGNEAKKHHYNKFRKTVSFNKGAASLVSSNYIQLNKSGNVFSIQIPDNTYIKWVESFSPTDAYSGGFPPNQYGGTILVVNIKPTSTNGAWTLSDHAGVPSTSGYKQIFLPNSDIVFSGAATLILVENEYYYNVAACFGNATNTPFIWATLMTLTSQVNTIQTTVNALANHEGFVMVNDPAGGSMANGQPLPNYSTTDYRAPLTNVNHGAPSSLYDHETGMPLQIRMRSDGHTVEMRGCVECPTLSVIQAGIFTMPIGYRPFYPMPITLKAVWFNNSGSAGYERVINGYIRPNGQVQINFSNQYDPDTAAYLSSYPNVMLYFNNTFALS